MTAISIYVNRLKTIVNVAILWKKKKTRRKTLTDNVVHENVCAKRLIHKMQLNEWMNEEKKQRVHVSLCVWVCDIILAKGDIKQMNEWTNEVQTVIRNIFNNTSRTSRAENVKWSENLL